MRRDTASFASTRRTCVRTVLTEMNSVCDVLVGRAVGGQARDSPLGGRQRVGAPWRLQAYIFSITTTLAPRLRTFSMMVPST